MFVCMDLIDHIKLNFMRLETKKNSCSSVTSYARGETYTEMNINNRESISMSEHLGHPAFR